MASRPATLGPDPVAMFIVLFLPGIRSPRALPRLVRRNAAAPGPPEQLADLLIGRLREVLVPEAHRVERLGRPGADDLVHLVLELLAGRRRRDRHGHDDPGRLPLAQRGD